MTALPIYIFSEGIGERFGSIKLPREAKSFLHKQGYIPRDVDILYWKIINQNGVEVIIFAEEW